MFSQAESQRLNLAMASAYIRIFLRDNKRLSDEDKQLLYQFIERIRAIEHILRGWLAGGHIATYHLEEENPSFKKIAKTQQQDLINESVDAHEKMLNFTFLQTKNLQADLEKVFDRPDWKRQKNKVVLLSQLNECFNAVIDELQNNRPVQEIEIEVEKEKEIEESEKGKEKIHAHKTESASTQKNDVSFQLALTDEEENTLEGDRDLYRNAKALGAKYYPYTQAANALAGQKKKGDEFLSKGMCDGLSRAWSDEIMEKGKSLKQPVSDKRVTYYQENQEPVSKYLENLHANEKIKYFSYNVVNDKLVLALLDNINDDSIYLIGFYPAQEVPHSSGVRKLKNGQIEFYDPNFGIFVFPDRNDFQVWFQHDLLPKYAGELGGKLQLINAGKQPSNATASLPIESPQHRAEQAINFVSKLTSKHSVEPWDINLALPIAARAVLENSDNEKQTMIYEMLKAKLHQTYRNTIFNSKEQHIQQKNQVIAQLDNEINRLQHLDAAKVDALKELKHRVQTAPLAATLATLISKWLNDFPPSGEKSHREIIQRHRIGGNGNTRSYKFILNLMNHYEINPLRMEILQMELVKEITKFARNHKGIHTKIVQADLANIQSPQAKLEAVKKTFARGMMSSFFYPSPLFLSSKEREFMKIIENMNVTHPSLLTHAIHTMDRLVQVEAKQAKAKRIPRT